MESLRTFNAPNTKTKSPIGGMNSVMRIALVSAVLAGAANAEEKETPEAKCQRLISELGDPLCTRRERAEQNFSRFIAGIVENGTVTPAIEAMVTKHYEDPEITARLDYAARLIHMNVNRDTVTVEPGWEWRCSCDFPMFETYPVWRANIPPSLLPKEGQPRGFPYIRKPNTTKK